MKLRILNLLLALMLPAVAGIAAQKKATQASAGPQANDEGYTQKIREYTTEPFFLTELVDHLPASASVPTPEKILSYAIGTPDRLTYSKDIYRYMRALAAATARVKVFTMGQTEEGREMLLVAVSDEQNLKDLDRHKTITARLADPRKLSPAEADRLIEEGKPFYWASGSIHSPETGSPEMLMELAYRLAVEETPFIQSIRRNSIVLITPTTEVDGHDREVDVYRYRKANPKKAAPGLLYWGKYVAHDNNRDGIGMALALSRNMMKTFLEYHPTVLHDLHESVPFLYTSTGTGPYNAWIDPILVDEWHLLAYHEIEEMTTRGVPGVWTHGFYDGWAPNYMFYVANGHNSMGRFYETFGGQGADTRERTVTPSATTRTWYRPNPPLAKVKWSLRNNINLQQSALLFAMNFVANNKERFLRNFYLKSRRSVEKAAKEGPAAYVIAAGERPSEAADLVNLLKLEGVEVHRLDQDVKLAGPAVQAGPETGAPKPAGPETGAPKKEPGAPKKDQEFPRGSYVVRMDQPYSRMADMLLDTQYFNVAEPRPYDDTGWTVGALRNVKTTRVTDLSILKAPMTLVEGEARAQGGIVPFNAASATVGPAFLPASGTSAGAPTEAGRNAGPTVAAYLLNHATENALATLRYRLKDVKMLAAEEPFEHQGQKFRAGSFLIPVEGNPADLRARLEAAAGKLGLTAVAAAALPKVNAHPLAAPRVALLHTWINTQDEGWYRIAFDNLKIPYTYISDHLVRDTPNLRERFEVIVFPPVRGSPARVVSGLPMRGDPIPWKTTELTPNLGSSPDTTDDMRGGMGFQGLEHLKRFVEQGGVLVMVASNAAIPVNYGLVEGVTISETRQLNARGTIVNAVVSDAKSPITYGYDGHFPVYFNQAPVFRVGVGQSLGFDLGELLGQQQGRPSGRGTLTDPDIPQGRPWQPAEQPRRTPAEEESYIPDDVREFARNLLPGPAEMPRVVLRFAEEKDLPVSGMLAGAGELANRPAVVDAPVGRGHIVLFANNPMWRSQTQGSYFLLFNTLLNYDQLALGRAAPQPVASSR